jgi:hypothetical protein
LRSPYGSLGCRHRENRRWLPRFSGRSPPAVWTWR